MGVKLVSVETVHEIIVQLQKELDMILDTVQLLLYKLVVEIHFTKV